MANTEKNTTTVTRRWLGIGRDINQVPDQEPRLKAKNDRLEIRITKIFGAKTSTTLEIIPCVYLGEYGKYGEYGDPIVTVDCGKFKMKGDKIMDIVWEEHGKDVSRFYNQRMFGNLHSSIINWLSGRATDEKEIRYLVQCQYDEGSVFEADTVNRLYLNKMDAMDDLAVAEEYAYIEFSNKYDKYNIEPKWSPDRTRCEINAYDGNGEVADTWVGRIEAMETLTVFKA